MKVFAIDLIHLHCMGPDLSVCLFKKMPAAFFPVAEITIAGLLHPIDNFRQSGRQNLLFKTNCQIDNRFGRQSGNRSTPNVVDCNDEGVEVFVESGGLSFSPSSPGGIRWVKLP